MSASNETLISFGEYQFSEHVLDDEKERFLRVIKEAVPEAKLAIYLYSPRWNAFHQGGLKAHFPSSPQSPEFDVKLKIILRNLFYRDFSDPDSFTNRIFKTRTFVSGVVRSFFSTVDIPDWKKFRKVLLSYNRIEDTPTDLGYYNKIALIFPDKIRSRLIEEQNETIFRREVIEALNLRILCPELLVELSLASNSTNGNSPIKKQLDEGPVAIVNMSYIKKWLGPPPGDAAGIIATPEEKFVKNPDRIRRLLYSDRDRYIKNRLENSREFKYSSESSEHKCFKVWRFEDEKYRLDHITLEELISYLDALSEEQKTESPDENELFSLLENLVGITPDKRQVPFLMRPILYLGQFLGFAMLFGDPNLDMRLSNHPVEKDIGEAPPAHDPQFFEFVKRLSDKLFHARLYDYQQELFDRRQSGYRLEDFKLLFENVDLVFNVTFATMSWCEKNVNRYGIRRFSKDGDSREFKLQGSEYFSDLPANLRWLGEICWDVFRKEEVSAVPYTQFSESETAFVNSNDFPKHLRPKSKISLVAAFNACAVNIQIYFAETTKELGLEYMEKGPEWKTALGRIISIAKREEAVTKIMRQDMALMIPHALGGPVDSIYRDLKKAHAWWEEYPEDAKGRFLRAKAQAEVLTHLFRVMVDIEREDRKENLPSRNLNLGEMIEDVVSVLHDETSQKCTIVRSIECARSYSLAQGSQWKELPLWIVLWEIMKNATESMDKAKPLRIGFLPERNQLIVQNDILEDAMQTTDSFLREINEIITNGFSNTSGLEQKRALGWKIVGKFAGYLSIPRGSLLIERTGTTVTTSVGLSGIVTQDKK